MCGYFVYSFLAPENYNYDNIHDYLNTKICLDVVRKSLAERGSGMFNDNLFKVDNSTRWIYMAHDLLPIFGNITTAYPLDNAKSSLLFNGQIFSINKTIIRESMVTSDGIALKQYLDSKSFLDYNFLLSLPHCISGAYSICYWNKTNNYIYLGRDLAGQKPLYFKSDDKTIIASTSIDLVASPMRFMMRDQVEANYNLPPVNTSIRKLKAGQGLVYDLRAIQKPLLFDYHEKFQFFVSHKDKLDRSKLKKLFFKAVNEIIPKNNNFSLALSGGLDSTNLAFALKEFDYTPKYAYSIYNGRNSDDIRQASLTAKYLNFDHKIINLCDFQQSEKFCSTLAAIDPASNAIHALSSCCAADQTSVLLTGDGGDEVSRRYRRFLYYQPFLKNLSLTYLSLKHKSSLKALFLALFRSDNLEQLSQISLGLSYSPLKFYNKHLDNSSLDSQYLDVSMQYELFYNLAERILAKSDIISYLYNVEIRTPFLNSPLYEYGIYINHHSPVHNISQDLSVALKCEDFVLNNKIGLA